MYRIYVYAHDQLMYVLANTSRIWLTTANTGNNYKIVLEIDIEMCHQFCEHQLWHMTLISGYFSRHQITVVDLPGKARLEPEFVEQFPVFASTWRWWAALFCNMQPLLLSLGVYILGNKCIHISSGREGSSHFYTGKITPAKPILPRRHSYIGRQS